MTEAKELIEVITYCHDQYKENLLNDVDFVGIFILLYLSIRKPKKWIVGKFSLPLIDTFDEK